MARRIERIVLGIPQAASAWIFDDLGRILLVQDSYDRRRWGPPGGAIETGESPAEAVQREFAEETCAVFEPTVLIGLYHFTYPSGRMPPWLAFCFGGRLVGTPRLPTTDELADIGWFSVDALPEPTTNLLKYVLPDARSEARGVVRLIKSD
jgi:8-oxo-dGTP pyrophosphatase MutT (NUDIX family)